MIYLLLTGIIALEILNFLNITEVKNTMATREEFDAKFAELNTVITEMKDAITAETAEIDAKLDGLEAQIKALGDFPDLTATVADLRASVDNVKAISEVNAVVPPPEGPVV